jgi:hypothetical protein
MPKEFISRLGTRIRAVIEIRVGNTREN